MPLYGDGRSGTQSALPSFYGGYIRGPSLGGAPEAPGPSRRVGQPDLVPTVVGAFAVDAGVSPTTTATFTLPAGLRDGDVGVFQVTANSGAGNDVVTAPTGWTLIAGPVENSQGNLRSWEYQRTLTAVEAGTTVSVVFGIGFRWTISGAVLRDANPTVAVTGGDWSETADDTAITLPSVAPTAPVLIVAMGTIKYLAATPVGVTTTGTGWSELAESTTTNATAPVFGAWIDTRTASATTPAEDLTLASSGRSQGFQLGFTYQVATPATSATATGTIDLAGTPTAQAPATGGGSITLGGTATGRAPDTAAGTITLGGTPTAQAPATALGGITLGGTATARGAATSTGTVTLGGTATGIAPGSGAAAGSITLGGSVTARAAATAQGVVALGGTATGAAPTTVTGAVVIGGAATARVPATVAGLITLSGLGNAAAAAVFDYNPHLPTTVVVAPHLGTAALAGGSGTAVLAPVSPATVTLAATQPSTAALTIVGAATATPTNVDGTALLQQATATATVNTT